MNKRAANYTLPGLLLEPETITNFPIPLIAINTKYEAIYYSKLAEDLFPQIDNNINVMQLIPELIEYKEKLAQPPARNNCQNYHLEKTIHDKIIAWQVSFIYLNTNEISYLIIINDISNIAKLETLLVENEKSTLLGSSTANMAHEINNVLGSVVQEVQNIKRRFEPTLPKNKKISQKLNLDLTALNQYIVEREIDTFLNAIRDATTRATTIINNTLNYSKKSKKPQHIDINHLIAETLAFLSTNTDILKLQTHKDSFIKTDFAPNLPKVQCNPQEIEQVLINIIKNAAYFLRELKNPQITVSSKIQNNLITIKIADNGPGIPPDFMPKIYEPFTTTKPQGTGLGLHICKYIIEEKHNWKLDVTSSKKGTSFTITVG